MSSKTRQQSSRSRPQPRATVSDAEIQSVLTTLAGTPQEIARIASGRTASQLHRKPAADAWSAQEILAHLRACAEVWGRSISRMLAEDRPTIRYVSPRGWIKKTDYLQLDFHDSLDAFSRQRAVLIATLEALDRVDWSRGATFTATTLGRQATVLSYADRIAAHELKHLDQLRRTVAT